VTETWEPVDRWDARLVLDAGGALEQFNAAGVLTSADVHVARTLGEVGAEADESVLLATALTCRAVRSGSVCLDLARAADVAGPTDDGSAGAGLPAVDPATLPWPPTRAWADAVAASPLVAAGVLRWEHDLLYLDRYHEQESQVLDDLARRAGTTPPHDEAAMRSSLARVFGGPTDSQQREACLGAAGRWTTVLTGGPGTGKTTAVAGLLVALREQRAAGDPPRVALTAPTGKAAARLQESVTATAGPAGGGPGRFTDAERAWLGGLQAMTLHRLLRRDPGNSTRFRHHRGNRLPHDIVVVDETSMVSLTMMARLLEAVRPDTRLVLVGDPDQLSSVDAGAVLGDLVRGYRERPDSPVVSLTRTHRFGEHIGALAAALRAGDADAALEVLSAGHAEVEWVTEEDPAPAVRAACLPSAIAARDAALSGDAGAALAALDRHRLLCAHRDGPYGVRTWNRRVEAWLSAETGDPMYDPAYPGRPLLVTANDYALGVYNGDSGVVVLRPEGPRVALPGVTGPRYLAPSRLGEVETMHAMTIHKSQGSQAGEVTVLLPEEGSRLLTRELFYTAVTRARDRVRVVGPEQAVRAAVDRRAQRASGLARRLRRRSG
jgi:exodeoxyribonuclease V alpha subunit